MELMKLTKLDEYDYTTCPGVISIRISGTNDPALVDILSEIEHADGKIYVEGRYYLYQTYTIIKSYGETYLELKVVETT